MSNVFLFILSLDRDGWREFMGLLNQYAKKGDRLDKQNVTLIKAKLKEPLSSKENLHALRTGGVATSAVELHPWQGQMISTATRKASAKVYEEVNAALEEGN